MLGNKYKISVKKEERTQKDLVRKINKTSENTKHRGIWPLKKNLLVITAYEGHTYTNLHTYMYKFI